MPKKSVKTSLRKLTQFEFSSRSDINSAITKGQGDIDTTQKVLSSNLILKVFLEQLIYWLAIDCTNS
uniref:Uncharacterized protein n=1 Tax=Magallana gigas TaxID=29159 RepID=K1P7H7_MAGGI